MPEGPEVTTIANGLSSILVGAEINEWTFNDKSRYVNRAPDGYNSFMVDVNNPMIKVKVTEVASKGKFIYWKFSNGWVLFQTLGMSGGWYHINKPHAGTILKYTPSTHLLRDMHSTSAKHVQNGKLYFNDQRRFGTLKWIAPTNARQELAKKLKEIGPDMLNSPPALDEFLAILRKDKNKSRTINRIITDQKQISGVGNYLRSEILYEAKISPHRLIDSLTDIDIEKIYRATIHKIVASYRVGGASIQHYSDIDNHKGTFAFHMAVYKKKHDPKGHVVKTEKIAGDGQSTYWVPSIQV